MSSPPVSLSASQASNPLWSLGTIARSGCRGKTRGGNSAAAASTEGSERFRSWSSGQPSRSVLSCLRLAEPDTIVCRCEDVRHEALTSFENWSDAKRQTRCGMGPCQGRVCGPATEALFGWHVSSVRPPFFPVPLSAMGAGPSRPSPNPAITERRHA